MPNGYTADLYEGKDVGLRAFLMGVGRGMGMAIMQRDDDPSEPIKMRSVSQYPAKNLADAIDEANRLACMPRAEAATRAALERADLQRRHEEAMNEIKGVRHRYKHMMEQVQAWQPETEHGQAVKRVALKYLQEAYDFDCRDGRSVYPEAPKDEDFSPDVWLARKRAENKRALDRARKFLTEELERVKEFNEAIAGFYADLPDA